MHKIILSLLLLFSLTIIFAQEPVSMRNYALGSVIDGEWENIYDPIELNFYNQKYFFTNLSDYAQQIHICEDSLQFMQRSALLSEFPFGFTFKSRFLNSARHAFLIRYKDNQLPDLSNGYGESETVSTHYADSNNDFVYDMRETRIDRYTDYNDISSRLLLLLNTSVPLGKNIFGFRFSIDNNKSKWDEASSSVSPSSFNSNLTGYSSGYNSFYHSYTYYDMIDNRPTLYYSEDGKFETKTCTSVFKLLISTMHPTDFYRDNSELRYDLNININDVNSFKTKDKYSGGFDQYIDDLTDYHGLINREYTRTNSNPTVEVFVNAGYRHNLDDATPRLKKSFWEVNLGLGGFEGSYKDNTSSTVNFNKAYTDTADVTWDIYDYTNTNTAEGSDLGVHAKFMGRSSVYFSDYVCFGYGLTFDMRSFDRETDNDYSLISKTLHLVGEEFESSEDRRQTIEESYSKKIELTQTNLTTILPVGLEFSLPKTSLTDNDAFSLRNFTFRLGTTFIQNMTNIDSRSKLNSVEVYSSITEYGDGEVYENHDTDNTYVNYQYKTHKTQGTKRFTAGIGYNHSENLNIDLGGYINSSGEDFFVGAMFTVKK